MKKIDLQKLIIEYINLKNKLDDLCHANPYGSYTYVNRKDLKESIDTFKN